MFNFRNIHKSLLEQVEVNLLYHPGHDYNLNEFQQAIEAGIAFINKELGIYPYTELRVGVREVEALFVKMRKTYHKDRTNEPIKEQPLIFAYHIDYLEGNKGTMALYKLAGTIGFDRFNLFVGKWVTESAGSLVFYDFYEKLKKNMTLIRNCADCLKRLKTTLRYNGHGPTLVYQPP